MILARLDSETWLTYCFGHTQTICAALRSVAIDLSRVSRSLLGQSSVSLVLLVLAAGSCQLYISRATLFRMQLRLQLFQVHSLDLSWHFHPAHKPLSAFINGNTWMPRRRRSTKGSGLGMSREARDDQVKQTSLRQSRAERPPPCGTAIHTILC